MSYRLHQQQLLHRYRACQFKRVMPHADAQISMHNPTCGDSVTIFVRIADTLVTQAAYQGTGCLISQVAASLLCEQITGMELFRAQAMRSNDMLSLLSMSLGPTRLKCAILSLEALHKAIAQYQESQANHAQSNNSY